MSKIYTPISRFFVDEANAADAVPANTATDAFGPVANNLTSQFRVTSKVHSKSGMCKVFAICSGVILIQPMDGDDSKINIILKPDGNISFLRIKYFIYRGVNKSDLIGNLILQPKDTANPNQPQILQKIWDEYISYNLPLYQAGLVPDPPDLFPSFLIGYDHDNQPGTSLIDYYFCNSTSPGGTISYQLPKCLQGDYIGNFSDVLGLDIVLDDGSYQLEKPNQLFNLDLAYARKNEHVFVTDPSASASMTNRYREFIHRFLDAAAFWGSHILYGEIAISGTPSPICEINDVYNSVLNKFQTKNKLYIYIQGERERSYNYFTTTRKVRGFETSPENNYTNQWPILIKENYTGTASSNTLVVPFQLDYDFDNRIYSADRVIIIDILAAGNNDLSSFPISQTIRHLPPANITALHATTATIGEYPTQTINLGFQTINSNYCAGFLFVYCSLKQEFPMLPYFKDLWPANIKNIFINDSNATSIYSATYDKSSVKNLSSIINFGGTVCHKVIFDTGLNPANQQTIPRRLFISMVKNNTSSVLNPEKFNVKNTVANYARGIKTLDQYINFVYGDNGFTIYKGQFNFSGPKNSLTLAHTEDFEKKYSYFQLGITEPEFQKLISDPVNVIPTDFDKLFFYLDEIAVANDFRQFNLGLRYEDNTGTEQIIYPSTSPVNNSVTVYTFDGLYFFSVSFSQYQNYFNEFSSCIVGFRPKSDSSSTPDNWLGEFGMDWVRKNDTNLPLDSSGNMYEQNIGHYYGSRGVKKELDINHLNLTTFKPERPEFIKYLNAFSSYPQKRDDLIYPSAFLTLFPAKDKAGNPTAFPKTTSDGSSMCWVSGDLDLKIDISAAPASLKLKYETDFFTVTPANSGDFLSAVTVEAFSYLEFVNKTVTGSSLRNVRISVKSAKEFDMAKKIQVIADGNTAGELLVLPNSKQFRRQTKVAMVSCVTKIDGSTTNTAINFNSTTDTDGVTIEKKIIHLMNQGLIDVTSIERQTLDLTGTINLSSGGQFNFNSKYVTNAGTSSAQFIENPPNNDHIHDDLYAALQSTVTTVSFDDFFVIFYIGEVCGSYDFSGNLISTTQGRSKAFNQNLVCVYKTGISDPSITPREINDTSTHELLHAAGLPHIFSNDSEFILQLYGTTNIMDYVPANISSKRFTLTRFQIDRVKKHYLIKPEL